jgi:dimethylhistidine N-methyltransferase
MPITAEIIDTAAACSTSEAFARDVLRGLSRQPKSLSSAWFYDDRGSRLFEEITRLDEYYLTRCEREILSAHAPQIGRRLGREPFRVLEIGAGDGHKTQILLRQFVEQGLDFEYVPIDICQRSIVDLVDKLRRTIRGEFLVRGIVAEYQDALDVLRSHQPMRNLVLFLGSSIGNFNHVQARRFLRGLRDSLAPGDLALIGFDLKKDPHVLQRAYDDSAGVTREFNLNLLDRINRELGGAFDRRFFQHQAAYNSAEACMESFLLSTTAQSVRIEALEQSFDFAPWEAIKVECSYKYDPPLMQSLAAASGFRPVQRFSDARQYFTDSLWIAIP